MQNYIKENNIVSYLNYNLDMEKLEKYVNMQDFQYKRLYNENIETLEDYIYYIIQQYNFELAMENEDIMYLLELIYGCEFDIEINEKGNLNLVDMQGAYLGGEESYENFDNIIDMIDRLSGSFLFDYYGIE